MEAERDRAMERATLKHKNTGRWAKNLVGKHATMENVEARNAIEEQLLRGERLRRRIQGVETDDEAEESDSDDADQPDEDPFDELRRLQGQEEEVAPSSSSGKKAAVWDMKFMSDARKRDAQQRRDEVDDFEREMAALDKQGVGEHEENRTATMDGRNASRGGEIRIPGALQQRDLVAEAFAGDDVAAEFEADKKAIMERDAPKEVDETLPGWGSWGGKGVKKARGRGQQQQRKYTRTIAGLEASQRKDANMKGVIINEKRDKKADKFKAKDLPFPYTSAAQYQLAMQNPIGPEWNTRTTHQRLTLPRVVTKPGKAILPIQRKF
ncbi:small nucleolar ribonucleoprotein complex subunit utp14 [Ceraceosorus bombacis]|uniref:Small nucleolar ribonucleoprotein complex subunit utp14 n=1 Tax=Ceraceosorus bombacis TaxID=401625 RepID=A0A0P1BJU1_9BASI|nr:small nucleolar ribonucleoprotein complex subunit utp14 [Ceraceosorus bombacis]